MKTREGDQPLPIPNNGESIHDLVIVDVLRRKELGTKRYGVHLQAFNGRNALLDLYEELLDAAMYTKQRLLEEEERDNRSTRQTEPASA